MTFFDALADFEEYEPDDDDIIDEDYITCSVCGMIVLRSSDSRAADNHCCLDCYYEKFWEFDNVKFSSTYFD